MNHETSYIAALAGAGTGKTYSLVENYILALFGLDGTGKKKRPTEILALTFTEKAALEMRLRILKRLWSIHDIDEELQKINQMLEAVGVAPTCKEEVKKICRALLIAPIETFHGFCASLLRREAHRLGLPENYTILTPREEYGYAKNILRPKVIAHLQNEDGGIKSLVARFRLGPGLLSMGFLDSLLQVYFKVPEQGISFFDLWAKRSAKSQQKAYVQECALAVEKAIFAFETSNLTVGSRNRIQNIKEIWTENRLNILGEMEHDVAQAFGQVREAIKGNFGNKDARSRLVNAVVSLGASLVDYFTGEDEAVVRNLLGEFHEAFSQFKQKAAFLSYADLLLRTRDGLIGDPLFRRHYKNKIAHVLVDEYQDTSPIQEDIIALILETKNHEREIDQTRRVLDQVELENGPSLFVVGDKKQSIYGFRGADVTLFDRLMHKMTLMSGNFEKRLLTINRRSNKKIISLVNLVAKSTLSRQGYLHEHALETNREDEGHCALWLHNSDGLDKTTANLLGAAIGIVNLLAKRADVTAKDIVVLVRRIKSAGKIKEKLERHGIAAKIVGGDGFFQQQEIVDILSALKLVIDPGAEFASMVVFRSPLVLLSDQEILDIKIATGGISLLHALKACNLNILNASSIERVTKFKSAIEKIKANLASEGLALAVDVLIEAGDLAYASGLLKNPHQVWGNVKKLKTLVHVSRRCPIRFIEELYEQIRENTREPLAETSLDDHAVTIMTIHQAKGLEFDIVVVADGESALPQSRLDILLDYESGLAIKPKGRAISRCAPRALDKNYAKTRYDAIKERTSTLEQAEVARLLYVALTRARREVYVVSSMASFKATESQLSLVSLFLKAMNDNKDQFLSLCSVEELQDVSAFVPEKKLVLEDGGKVFQGGPEKSIVFASSLKANDDLYKPWTTTNFITETKFVHGSLAHELLALVGRAGFKKDPEEIDAMLDAALRAMGHHHQQYASHTKEAVKITLKVLCQQIPKAAETIFEMPLSCSPHETVLVEGFADLVIITTTEVLVVEFKSTLNAAMASKSYAQVLAYAHALSRQFDLPIYFAVHLIGAKNPIKRHLFDETAKRVFLQGIMSGETSLFS